MTLLITVFAALIATICWYHDAPDDTMKLSTLCFMYWGASLMWFVDAIFAYMEEGAAYFTPGTDVMINDAFLGICVVALGMITWQIILLVKDPQGKLRASLHKRM